MPEVFDPQSSNKTSVIYDWLEIFVLWLFLIGSLLVFPIMIGLLFAGLWEMARGLAIFAGYMPTPDKSLSSEGASLEHAIKGIEFFLLAPLAYFVLLSLSNYIKNSRANVEPATARERILGVKALTMGLLISVIAADLVGKILSREGLVLSAALGEALVIIVLGAYFFCLELLGRQSPTVPK